MTDQEGTNDLFDPGPLEGGINRRNFLRLTGAAGAAGALGVTATGSAAAVPSEKSDITEQEALDGIEYDLEHPRVNTTPEELETARWNVENTQWGQDLLENLTELTDSMPRFLFDLYYDGDEIPTATPFVEMSQEKIRELAPIIAPDDTMYVGFPWPDYHGKLANGNVSPIDGSPLRFAGTDKPGKMMDAEGREFPGTHDGVEITDDGDGWVADPAEVPDDWAASDLDEPTTFWFVAKYNGWISRTMLNTLSPAARIYALTEDQEYARTVAALLDVLATACPKSGPIVDRGGATGKFYRGGYTAGRIQEDFVDAADLVWNSGELDAASLTNDGLTIKKNVARNLVVETADYCWRDMFGGIEGQPHANYARIYHNGTTDYIQGFMLASMLLDLNVGYDEFALDGQVSLQNFLANTIFRDGVYYETSSLYSVSYIDWANQAYHLRTESYPDGLDVFDNSRFTNLNVNGPRRQSVAGRIPRYGDVSEPDIGVDTSPKRGDFGKVVWFYARADSQVERNRYAQTLAEIAGGDPNDQLLADVNADMGYWEVRGRTSPLFMVKDRITGYDLDELEVENRDSELLGGVGMAMFRPETGHDRGAMMRYGASLSHTHFDELGLHFYGGGREMSYDPGRKPKPQLLYNWWKQTVTHNTAVVNEWSQVPQEDDGGSINTFADRSGYTVADVDNDQAYAHEDVDTYRRTTGLIDVDDEHSYLVDLFRVDGPGKEVVDYSFHGQGVDFDTDLSLTDPAPGSVASSEYYWGDQITRSGYIEGHENENFDAPPGNGYGFLGNPRSSSGADTWNATWSVHSDRGGPGRVRLTMLGNDDHEIIVADGPDPMVWKLGLDHETYDLKYALARDESAGPTQYAGVIEPVANEFQVQDVSSLRVDDADEAGFDPVAMEISLGDGRTDYAMSTVGDDEFTAKPEKNANLTTDAGFAHVRRDADGIDALRMEGGTHLHAKFHGERLIVIDADEASTDGTIQSVDYDEPSLLVDADLPTGDVLAGRYLLVDADEYSHNSQFQIESVASEGDSSRVFLADTEFDITRATVGAKPGPDVLESPPELPLVHTEPKYNQGPGASDYFDGKMAVNPDTGEWTTVENVGGDYRRIEVADGSIFAENDRVVIIDVKAGDTASLPTSVEVRREDGEYVVNAPDEVDVALPGNKR
jgi:hypothetical protein